MLQYIGESCGRDGHGISFWECVIPFDSPNESVNSILETDIFIASHHQRW